MGSVSALLHTSADWADFDEIAQSWFENDEHVARVVADIGGRQGAQSVDRVLEEILAPRREKWAAYFLGTALWLREAPEDSLWRGFVILAQALASGRDLADISVMPVIAARTVAVLSNAPALRTEPATAGKRRRNRPTRRADRRHRRLRTACLRPRPPAPGPCRQSGPAGSKSVTDLRVHWECPLLL